MTTVLSNDEIKAWSMVGYLGSELEEAIEAMEDMILYVPEYIRNKWNHDGALSRARGALKSYQAMKLSLDTSERALEASESASEVPRVVNMPPPPGSRQGHEPSCEALYGDYHCTCQ